MATEKKVVKHLTGKVELKVTLSQLRSPGGAKLHRRGPGQIGQMKHTIPVRIGKVKQEEMSKRLDLAVSILNTGKVPAEAKGGSSKTKDATIKGREKALQKELDKALARIEELEAYAKPDADPPAEPTDPDVTEVDFEGTVPDAADPVEPTPDPPVE